MKKEKWSKSERKKQRTSERFIERIRGRVEQSRRKRVKEKESKRSRETDSRPHLQETGSETPSPSPLTPPLPPLPPPTPNPTPNSSPPKGNQAHKINNSKLGKQKVRAPQNMYRIRKISYSFRYYYGNRIYVLKQIQTCYYGIRSTTVTYNCFAHVNTNLI